MTKVKEDKVQTVVRTSQENLDSWKAAAAIRSISLNAFLIEAANRHVAAGGLDSFKRLDEIVRTAGLGDLTTPAPFAGVKSERSEKVVGADSGTVLKAFDDALQLTPVLQGQRKWIDPVAMRIELTGSMTDTALLAFDVALSRTPILQGERKWVDPNVLRLELEGIL